MTNLQNLNQRIATLAARQDALRQELAQNDIRMDELRKVRTWLVDADEPDAPEAIEEPVEDVPPELEEPVEEVEEVPEEEPVEEEPVEEQPVEEQPTREPYQLPDEMFGVDLTPLDERTRLKVMSGDQKTIEALGGTPPTRVPITIADFTG